MGSPLLWLGIVVAAAVVGACNPSASTTGVDAGAVSPNPCDPRLFAGLEDASRQGPGETYDYVINRMIVDQWEHDDPGQDVNGRYGFNLDGRSSASRVASQLAVDCSHGDYFSTVDPDQNIGSCVEGVIGGGPACRGGVDNQLVELSEGSYQWNVYAAVEPQLNRQINAGRYTLLIRVAGVNGALGTSLNDPAVTIRVYPVAWPAFQVCDAIQQQQQMYAVDDRSLRQAGNLDSPVLEFAGCVVRGRLRQQAPRATGATTPMMLPLLPNAQVSLHDLQLRFDLAETEGRNGNLGATTLSSDVLLALGTLFPGLPVADALPRVVEGFIDIALAGRDGGVSCYDSPAGLISVGLGFTALRAYISPTTVSGPIPGACGAPAGDGGVDGGLMDATGNHGGDAGGEDVETGVASFDAGVGDVGSDR